MANPELGAKQICPTCSAKFYDLGRRPATCPKCQTAFDPEEVVKVRRVRTRSTTADYEDDEAPKPAETESDGFEDEVDETPEIDQGIEDEVVEADEDEQDGSGKAPKTAMTTCPSSKTRTRTTPLATTISTESAPTKTATKKISGRA